MLKSATDTAWRRCSNPSEYLWGTYYREGFLGICGEEGKVYIRMIFQTKWFSWLETFFLMTDVIFLSTLLRDSISFPNIGFQLMKLLFLERRKTEETLLSINLIQLLLNQITVHLFLEVLAINLMMTDPIILKSSKVIWPDCKCILAEECGKSVN